MGYKETKHYWCNVCELGVGPTQNDVDDPDEDTAPPPRQCVRETLFIAPNEASQRLRVRGKPQLFEDESPERKIRESGGAQLLEVHRMPGCPAAAAGSGHDHDGK